MKKGTKKITSEIISEKATKSGTSIEIPKDAQLSVGSGTIVVPVTLHAREGDVFTGVFTDATIETTVFTPQLGVKYIFSNENNEFIGEIKSLDPLVVWEWSIVGGCQSSQEISIVGASHPRSRQSVYMGWRIRATPATLRYSGNQPTMASGAHFSAATTAQPATTMPVRRNASQNRPIADFFIGQIFSQSTSKRALNERNQSSRILIGHIKSYLLFCWLGLIEMLESLSNRFSLLIIPQSGGGQ